MEATSLKRITVQGNMPRIDAVAQVVRESSYPVTTKLELKIQSGCAEMLLMLNMNALLLCARIANHNQLHRRDEGKDLVSWSDALIYMYSSFDYYYIPYQKNIYIKRTAPGGINLRSIVIQRM